MLKKLFGIALCILMVTSMAFAAGGGQKAATTDVVELQCGITLTLDSHYGMGLQEFKRLAEQYSNGTVKVEIFPNSQLGSEREMFEGVSMGTHSMTVISTGPVPNFFPDFSVLDLPYLFPTAEVAYSVLDGEIGTSLLKQLETNGIYGLGFWENGFRHVTNSVRAIKTPADLKGLKIRTMENPIHMHTYIHYGAAPTPMAMGEVFLALQTKTVDGQENPAINILTSRLNEVQSHMSLTGNFYSPALFVINKALLEKMTPQQRDAVLKAAAEAKNWQRKYSQDNTADAIAKIKAGGTTVTEVNLNDWVDFSRKVYTDNIRNAKINLDIVKQIQAVK